MNPIYEFQVKDNKQNLVSMSKYRNKVLLIVNTATGCGFTPQYSGLEELYKKYKKDGFEVLDFPCDQFGHQAPGDNEEINNFCTLTYNTTFDRFSKIDVNGKNESQLFKHLKSQSKSPLGGKIKWNFTKFLISKDGSLVKRFSPTTTPEKIDEYIKKII